MRFIKNSELNRIDKSEFISAQKMPVTIVLDNVRSGLNVGSFFRTADAFRVKEIVLCGITAIPPDREILKSALGATESVAWTYEKNTATVLENLKNKGVKILAVEQSDMSNQLHSFSPEVNTEYALVFGHEVKGVDEGLIPYLDGSIEVPQSGTKHSLNVSVCGGIVLWDFYRKLML